MKMQSSAFLNDAQHSSYTRTPEEQRKQLDYWENVVAAKDQALQDITNVVRERDTEIETLKLEVEDLKIKNTSLMKYRAASKISISEIPDYFGEDDTKKLNKALTYIKKYNLIITK